MYALASPTILARHLASLLAWLLLTAHLLPAAAQPCSAYAGTLEVAFGPHCLVQGEALLTGAPSSDAVIPAGFSSTYLLTRTNGLIIEQLGSMPAFLVGSVDVWRIHRLVFDPTTLDLGLVQLGQTSAYELQNLIIQGGGEACGSLSMTGAAAKTMECGEPCTAFAAGMAADSTAVCLVDGQATLFATVVGPGIVPAGFEQRFLLSRTNGLIIEQISGMPSFTVSGVDSWRIHNLVYHPATLDPGTMALGTTTVIELQSLLLQGGGSICASLDISGAPMTTVQCNMECTAGTDSTITVCLNDPPFTMIDYLGGEPCPGGAWANPANPQVSGTFNPGSDAAGIYTYTVLDPDGQLHMATLTIYVYECPGIGDLHFLGKSPSDTNLEDLATALSCPADIQLHKAIHVWPNPVVGMAHLALPFSTEASVLAVELTDALGRRATAMTHVSGNELLLDASTLASGLWTVRVARGNSIYHGRFVR
ncbi:MAG: T9SS type A sorting domain-containing protein [Flavobacteriales bacterium]|nr:T9SS type A sorting domain-containing protein [Flavobacteriales bacterium]